MMRLGNAVVILVMILAMVLLAVPVIIWGLINESRQLPTVP